MNLSSLLAHETLAYEAHETHPAPLVQVPQWRRDWASGRADEEPKRSTTGSRGPAPSPTPYSTPSPAPARDHSDLRLLSVVAHELRNPLNTLLLSSQLLVEDFDLLHPQQARGMAAGIQHGVIWLQGLVENLLCAAMMSDGQLPSQPQAGSLLAIVADIRPIVDPLLAQRGQRLRVRTRGRLPDVWANPRGIGQVLINLIGNASKFSERGTVVDLTLRPHGPRGEYLRVTVADRGPGLPAGRADRLFEPFYRPAETRRSGPEGLGLGLAIVKGIVEAHQGRVGAQNRRGAGARFWVDLPVADLPVADFPVADLPVADLPVADLPVAPTVSSVSSLATPHDSAH